MTSRERVWSALEHRQPDRVPVDLGATPSSGIAAIAYHRLCTHLGLPGRRTRIYDVVQQLAQPEEIVLDRFRIDAVDLGRTFNTRDEDWYDIVLAEGTPAQYPVWFRPERQPDGSYVARHPDGTPIAHMPAGGTFFDQTYFPYLDGYPSDFSDLRTAMTYVLWAAFAHSPWDHASEPDFWNQLRQRALELRRSTDRAIVLSCGCNLFEWGCFLRRMDNFLMDIYAEPAQVERLLDALVEIHLEGLERICRAVGDLIDVIRFGDDLGMDAGPFMDPDTYAKLFKPRHAMICEFARRHTRAKRLLHSCGSIYALVPHLIEAGFEIINPVQTSAHDMEPEKLKREFGQDICFWGGGCDTRRVLNRGTPAEVKDHVRRRLEILAPGGGFVFATVHNILPEVPPENIEALYEALEEFN
jgi:uroporphyrinogen decarboxylase